MTDLESGKALALQLKGILTRVSGGAHRAGGGRGVAGRCERLGVGLDWLLELLEERRDLVG